MERVIVRGELAQLDLLLPNLTLGCLAPRAEALGCTQLVVALLPPRLSARGARGELLLVRGELLLVALLLALLLRAILQPELRLVDASPLLDGGRVPTAALPLLGTHGLQLCSML